MTASTHERYIAIEPSPLGGVVIRTAKSLRELITDLILNSGPEIAAWAEGEAKRAAEKWRESEAAEAAEEDSEIPDGDKAEVRNG